MIFRQSSRITSMCKRRLAKASWDKTELTIPEDEQPILSIKYDPKYISVLGFHNTITPENDIVSTLISDQ